MTVEEAIARAAEKYRKDGYTVALDAPPEALPPELRRDVPRLIATRNGRSTLCEVWVRGELHDLPPQTMPRGWDFDAVLLPKPEYPDAPGPGFEATPEFAAQLLDEFDNLLPNGAARARFLVAWAAAEAAMRVAARRTGLETDRLAPRDVARELVHAGVISNDRYDAFRDLLPVRNRLAHGVPGDGPRADQVEFLAGIARELIVPQPVAAA